MSWNGQIEAVAEDATEIIGVFGGTFDPPHIAHLVLASEAQAQLKLNRVLWLLTAVPPHKTGVEISSIAVREALVRAAISNQPAFELSLVDIERDPPHYAYDSMRILTKQYPRSKLVYLMGEDSLRDLPTWYRPEAFLDICSILGVIRRVGVEIKWQELEARLPGIRQKVRYIEVPMIEISSSDIRRRVANGDPFRYYLPEKVYELVIKYQLYRNAQA